MTEIPMPIKTHKDVKNTATLVMGCHLFGSQGDTGKYFPSCAVKCTEETSMQGLPVALESGRSVK